jgi:hypothetical protein
VSSKSRVVALLGAGLASVALCVMGVGSAFAESAVHVELTDDCDPATFNAAVGPGTCRGEGTTTFAAFIAELQATRVAEDWAFAPPQRVVDRNQTVLARNVGGETHSFTCVSKFGGGVVLILNQLSGDTTPAVPCANENVPASFVLSGQSRTVHLGDFTPTNGVFQFECFIHPWMRTTLRVRSN